MELSPHSFSAQLVHLDGDAVLVLTGDLDLASAPLLARELDPLVVDGPSQIILECSGLSFLDSSGIAALVGAQNRLAGQNRRLIVRAPRSNIVRVLEVTGLTEFLQVGVEAARVNPTS